MEYPYNTANLSGPRFVNLCMQLPAYNGALVQAARKDAEETPEPESRAVLMFDEDIEVTHA